MILQICLIYCIYPTSARLSWTESRVCCLIEHLCNSLCDISGIRLRFCHIFGNFLRIWQRYLLRLVKTLLLIHSIDLRLLVYHHISQGFLVLKSVRRDTHIRLLFPPLQTCLFHRSLSLTARTDNFSASATWSLRCVYHVLVDDSGREILYPIIVATILILVILNLSVRVPWRRHASLIITLMVVVFVLVLIILGPLLHLGLRLNILQQLVRQLEGQRLSVDRMTMIWMRIWGLIFIRWCSE